MKVFVGGKSTEMDEGTSLGDFMESHALTSTQAIVVLNGRVIHEDAWAATLLEEEDHLELVSLVGGG